MSTPMAMTASNAPVRGVVVDVADEEVSKDDRRAVAPSRSAVVELPDVRDPSIILRETD